MAALRAEPPDSRPGAPFAEIVGLEPRRTAATPSTSTAATARLRARYAWSLIAPASSAATLSEPSARQSAFVADVPGTYEVTLTVGNGTAAAVRREEGCDHRQSRTGSPRTTSTASTSPRPSFCAGSVLAGVHQDSDPDGDALTATLAIGDRQPRQRDGRRRRLVRVLLHGDAAAAGQRHVPLSARGRLRRNRAGDGHDPAERRRGWRATDGRDLVHRRRREHRGRRRERLARAAELAREQRRRAGPRLQRISRRRAARLRAEHGRTRARRCFTPTRR